MDLKGEAPHQTPFISLSSYRCLLWRFSVELKISSSHMGPIVLQQLKRL
ncbi:hypothetical protein Hanom_Chr02g00114831 [Helianthus anomalus]